MDINRRLTLHRLQTMPHQPMTNIAYCSENSDETEAQIKKEPTWCNLNDCRVQGGSRPPSGEYFHLLMFCYDVSGTGTLSHRGQDETLAYDCD